MRVYLDTNEDEAYLYEASPEEEKLISAASLVSTGRCQELPNCMFSALDLADYGQEMDVNTFLENFEVY